MPQLDILQDVIDLFRSANLQQKGNACFFDHLRILESYQSQGFTVTELDLASKTLVNLLHSVPKLDLQIRKQLCKKLMQWTELNTLSFSSGVQNKLHELSSNSERFSSRDISFISFIVEDLQPIRNAMVPCLSLILHNVAKTISILVVDECNELEHLFKAIKLSLQILQIYKTSLQEYFHDCENKIKSAVGLIGQRILYLISVSKNSNVSMLCGTVVGFMLSYHSPLSALVALTNLVSTNHGDQKVEIVPYTFVEVPPRETPLHRAHCAVWLLRGVMACSPSLGFLHLSSQAPHHLTVSFLSTREIFFMIMETCKLDTVQYHGFYTLNLWWKNALKAVKRAKPISEEMAVYSFSALQLVYDNWDSQVNGAVSLLMQMFACVIDIQMLLNENGFLTNVYRHLISTSCHVKGKYAPMSIMVKKLGVATMLDMDPNLIESLVEGLGINHLASSSSKVYKSIVSSVFEGRNNNFDLLKWEILLAPTLVDSITSISPLIRTNALHYWLPINLKLHSSVLDKIKEDLKNSGKPSGVYLFAVIGLLKVARSIGMPDVIRRNHDVIADAITSFDNETRSNAFWVICKSCKKSQMIEEEEWQLLYDNIPVNLNSDCASFRHDFVFCVKMFLSRIFYSAIAAPKQNDERLWQYAGKCMKFITWLQQLCIDSLFVSSSFQRKLTALKLFEAILQTFAVKQRNSARVSCDEHKTILNIMEKFDVILPCKLYLSQLFDLLQDSVPDIRELAYSIVFDYFRLETLLPYKDLTWKVFHKLLSSNKSHDVESGSVMIEFYLQAFILQNVSFLKKYDCRSNLNLISSPMLNNCLTLLKQVKNNMSEHFSKFQENVLDGSYRFPVFGWMLGLAKCLNHLWKVWDKTDDINSELLQKMFNFSTEVIDKTTEIINFLLQKIFSCSLPGAENEFLASADFEEMSRRVDKIIEQSKGDSSKGNPLLSMDHEVILSSTWLSLRYTCALLSATTCFILKINSFESYLQGYISVLTRICNTFITVLSMCRHRGVIESCYLSFVELCIVLFSSRDFHNIPVQLMEGLLEDQGRKLPSEKKIPGATITRRSAGLPLIVDAILSASVSSSFLGSENLLSRTMTKLAESLVCLEHVSETSSTVDLPQVDALFILKNILQNTTLGPYVATHLTPVFIAAIRCLSSPLWIVRNASTHLLGVLSSRMLGQKHIEEKSSSASAGSLTAVEFFSRFPLLREHFKGILNSGMFINNKKHGRETQILKPEVFPIVSLMSKLVCNVEAGDLKPENSELSFIVEPILQLLACPLFQVRTLSAKFVLTLFTDKQIDEMLCGYFSRLPNDVELNAAFERFPLCQNELHGWLKVIFNLIKSNRGTTDCKVFTLLQCRTWLASLSTNPCPFTAALYLQVFTELWQRRFVQDLNGFDVNLILSTLKAENELTVEVNHPDFARAGTKFILSLYPDVSYDLLLQKLDVINNDVVLTYIGCLIENIEKCNNVAESCEKAVKLLLFFWQKDEIDQRLERSAVKLFCKIAPCLIQSASFDPDRCEALFKHILILNETNQCLSMKCSLLKAMSFVCVCVLTQDPAHLDRLKLWAVNVRSNTSEHFASEELRLSAAESLKICGTQVLHWIEKQCTDGIDHEFHEELINLATMLFAAAIYLLQDEQANIRESACCFVTLLCGGDHVVQHNLAIKKVSSFFTSHLPPSFVLLDTILKINLRDTEPKQEEQPRSSIFKQESFNVYAEPEQLAMLLEPYVRIIAAKLSQNSSSWVNEHVNYSMMLLQEINNLVSRFEWKYVFQRAICSLFYVKVTFEVAIVSNFKNETLDAIRQQLLSFQTDSPEPVQAIIRSIPGYPWNEEGGYSIPQRTVLP